MSALQPGQRILHPTDRSWPARSRTARSALALGGDFVAIELAFLVILALLTAEGPGGAPAWRIFLGLMFALFAPGYSLQAALFSRPGDLDRSERLALSLGLSLAILPALALGLDRLPWGFQPGPIVLGLSLVVLPCATVAVVRRARPAPVEGSGAQPQSQTGRGRGPRDLAGRLLLAGFTLALLVAGASSALTLVVPDPFDQFTEFYILGPGGWAVTYPRGEKAGGQRTTTVGIANHEGSEQVYRVRVIIGGLAVGESPPISLPEGAAWEGSVEYTVPVGGGAQEVSFILERGNRPEPYRALSLRLNVQSHASPASK